MGSDFYILTIFGVAMGSDFYILTIFSVNHVFVHSPLRP